MTYSAMPVGNGRDVAIMLHSKVIAHSSIYSQSAGGHCVLLVQTANRSAANQDLAEKYKCAFDLVLAALNVLEARGGLAEPVRRARDRAIRLVE